MSNNLRDYGSLKSGTGDASETDMSVTAFVGGKHGACVQFTMCGRGNVLYCCLAENQVRDLIKVLRGRVNGVHKYLATSSDLDKRILPELLKEAE